VPAREVEERDGAAVRVPPPLVYLGAVIGGVLLHAYVVALPLRLPGLARGVLGGLLAGVGIGLLSAAFGLFRRTGQDPKPWEPTPELVVEGVYRYTRNPMYVGLALLQAGIGVASGNGWIVLLVPVVLAIVYVVAVRHEEAYLERKFGAAYTSYRDSVRRWI